MIDISAKEVDGTWYGIAYIGEELVATALDSTKEEAINSLLRSIPANGEHRILEKVSGFAERTMLMLKELEAGNEESKRFTLASQYLPEPAEKVLRAAAAIPIGYVASYGDIAKAVDTGPRIVGRIMARNPVYPIVPCHRVVGSDFSLVGYGGGKSPRALQAKLTRLSREARGFTTKKGVSVNGKNLIVYPAEYVIRKARKHLPDSPYQRKPVADTKLDNTG